MPAGRWFRRSTKFPDERKPGGPPLEIYVAPLTHAPRAKIFDREGLISFWVVAFSHVVRLSSAAGQEFNVTKPDNATGNFVKITQRMSVRIEIDPDQPEVARLAPGMSVVVSVDTGAAPEH